MGERNAGERGGAKSRRHAGNDFERDASRVQSVRFLAAAAEDERIAPLEPDHAPALSGGGDHRVMDRLAAFDMPGAQLRHADTLGLCGSMVEHRCRNETVIKHEIGMPETFDRAKRNEARM